VPHRVVSDRRAPRLPGALPRLRAGEAGGRAEGRSPRDQPTGRPSAAVPAVRRAPRGNVRLSVVRRTPSGRLPPGPPLHLVRGAVRWSDELADHGSRSGLRRVREEPSAGRRSAPRATPGALGEA
jgi:hypothetical protein